MNYVEQLNAFDDWLTGNYLTGQAKLLWYRLVSINNKCGWREWFQIGNQRMLDEIDVANLDTFYKYRNELIENKLIEVRNGKRNTPPTYRISPLKRECSGMIVPCTSTGTSIGTGEESQVNHNDNQPQNNTDNRGEYLLEYPQDYLADYPSDYPQDQLGDKKTKSSIELFNITKQNKTKQNKTKHVIKAKDNLNTNIGSNKLEPNKQTNNSKANKTNKPKIHKPRANASKEVGDFEDKKVYGEHKNVWLKDREVQTIVDKYKDVPFEYIVDVLSQYKAANNKGYKSDYGAINTWVAKKAREDYARERSRFNNQSHDNLGYDFFDALIDGVIDEKGNPINDPSRNSQNFENNKNFLPDTQFQVE